MPLMNRTFEIPRRSVECKLCALKLTAGDYYYSFLDSLTAVPERHDFCMSCWEKEGKERAGSHGFWKARSAMKSPPVPPSKRKAMRALSLLKEYTGAPLCEAEQFILALYLARKKVLALRSEISAERGIYQYYEVVETSEMIPVKAIELSSLDFTNLQAAIAKKLADETS